MENNDIKKLYTSIHRYLNNRDHKNDLPSNCFFLNKDTVLALPNPFGDSRHPYSVDGLTLWAYSSGYITINDSNFYVVPSTLEGKEPYLAFFGGLLNKDRYDFFSLSGAADSELGREKVEKYTIFYPTKVVYLRVYKKVIYSLTMSVTLNKEIIYSINVVNNSSKPVDVYSSSFVNAQLIHSNYESEETKWFRRCSIEDNDAVIYSVEDISREIHLHNYALISKIVKGDVHSTATRMLYVGDKNGQLSTSKSLRNGFFDIEKKVSQFIDSAVYGDIVKNHLLPKESVEAHYRISLAFSEDELNQKRKVQYNNEFNKVNFKQLETLHKERFKNKLEINFKGLKDTNISDETFNNFLNQVIEQVDYCSRAKNSSPMMMGVRDIAQMLEASLMWDPKFVKEKIIWLLDYVCTNGRVPRQVGRFDINGEAMLDDREFIDQGQWIISLVYKYLCYTNDFSILDKKCGYIEIIRRNRAKKVNKSDSIFEHLKTIINYLISNIAPDTGCLRTLFGDWNDAVDGLGVSLDPNEEYGNGVSIMASFHLYMNLHEFIEIAKYKGLDTSEYQKIRENLFVNIKKHGVVHKGNESRIVHGWGDNKSFYVGSFNDVDGVSRHSSTSNSFYVISHYYEKDPSLKETVLNAFDKLEGKYGLLTFDVPFDKSNASLVGRIVNLPKGTAENAATYIHAGIYAIKALSMMGEGSRAYHELLKLIPITHEKISTSPFVMPNSYGYNKELGVDGESMNDWFTGSSNTILKACIDGMCGITPYLDNKIRINPIQIPVDEMNIKLYIKGRILRLHHINKGGMTLKLTVNGQPFKSFEIDLNEIKDKTINVESEF